MPLGTPSQAYGTLLYHRCNPLNALSLAIRARARTPHHDFWRRKNALRWIAAIRSFGYWLEPRYIFRAGRLDQ